MPASKSRVDRPVVTGPGGLVTLQDVADSAGVSRATASRVLNGSSRVVGSELADRVHRAAKVLRYVSNAPAQALARSTSTVVGLIVHAVDDPYFSAIAAGAMRVAAEHDLLTMMASTFRDPEREIDYVSRLRAHRARGVLLVGSGFTATSITERLHEEIAAFAAGGGRVACIGEHSIPFDTVLPENRRGAEQAAKLLLALGHRRIGVVGGPPELTTVAHRLDGFRDTLRAAGVELPEHAIVAGDFTRDGGYAGMIELARRMPEVTAVFALNDPTAVGVMAALRDELGRRVPEEISVVGFDDIPAALDVSPTLTTVRLPLEEMGERAMRLLLDDPGRPPRTLRVKAEVVSRGSTAPPRQGS
ncbi:LacI family DNA-binding transcriptional regulator [Pseudonocardia sp. Cha107L01]|uniref:LacI family DNA-binding transcriptional regulator n=1 Tax=Pseudonocardia sp. Cha107L01 TaxID=3457576 RepID=UPI00403E4AD6